jgi:hypothetical protein
MLRVPPSVQQKTNPVSPYGPTGNACQYVSQKTERTSENHLPCMRGEYENHPHHGSGVIVPAKNLFSLIAKGEIAM